MDKKVVFKFCGGCNPLFDRSRVYNRTKQLLNNQEEINKEYSLETLIILNGCTRGCIVPEEFQEKYNSIIDTQNYLVSPHAKEAGDISNWIEGELRNC